MHIALVHHIPYQFHGLSDMAFSLTRRGHKVSDISWSGSRKLMINRVAKGLTSYLLPGFNFSPAMMPKYPYVPGLFNVVSRLKPDVVHAQSQLFLATFSTVKGASKHRLPCVVTVHGILAKRELHFEVAQRVYLSTIGSWCFKKATRVICLTKSDASEVTKYGCQPRKIKVVSNGVDTNDFKPNLSCERDNLVAWIGRFVPEKGLLYLREAIEKVSKIRNDVRFMLIGDGPLRSKFIRELNAKGLRDRIEFRGSIPHEEISQIMPKASLFVLPSIKEGMPITLLEAMACGKAVIGSDIPGINDVITHGENGFLVPPRNSDALALAMTTLLENKSLRRQIGENARRLMVKKYQWDTVAIEIEKVYFEAIRETDAPAPRYFS